MMISSVGIPSSCDVFYATHILEDGCAFRKWRPPPSQLAPLVNTPALLPQKKVFNRSVMVTISEWNNTPVQEDTMDLNTFRLAEIIHNERVAEAAQARRRAQRSVSSPLRDRLRLALSKRLITWGEQLAVPTVPIKARL
jgi:hypothetical protein